MAELSPQNSPVTNIFECADCFRKYSKKEHLQRHERSHTGSKPFKCAICDRSFSRGDVLSRHVKNHRRTGKSLNPPGSFKHPDTPSSAHNHGTIEASTTSEGDLVDENSLAASPSAASQPVWPFSGGLPSGRDAQHRTSSLLWPGSEDFIQSLNSLDGMMWNHSMPVFWQPANLSHESSSHLRSRHTEHVRDEEASNVQDGHRAVQTVNGLITDTLLNVTSLELSDLTPRFIDSSLHMFFTKFVPIFPVVHRPTFVYRECSAPLLLNAIALGSLFLGSDDAVTKGEALWRLAYTAIATSWPVMITHRREYDQCSGVELVLTSLLSQTYAALSRNQVLRMTSQTFYGLSMHWAQYCGMYNIGGKEETSELHVPSGHDPVEIKMGAWKAWAARETRLRTLLGLCIIDGVVSQFSGNLVNTWQATNSLPLAADDEIFNADTPDSWIRHMSTRPKRKTIRFCDLYHSILSLNNIPTRLEYDIGLFDMKTLLEILSSLASESSKTDPAPIGARSQLKIARVLSCIRQHLSQSGSLQPAERAVGLIRWHAVCLDMLANVARGARRLCHQHNITQNILGGVKRQEVDINPHRWVQSVTARKCLLHASEIHALASQLPLGVAHDVYLPGALFAAATTYSSFALYGVSRILLPSSVDWDAILFSGFQEMPETVLPSASDDARKATWVFLSDGWDKQNTHMVVRNLSYEISSLKILLHGLSMQWGVAHEMVKVVEAWAARA